MLLYIMLYIVLAYLMLFAALTNAVCLNNASSFLSLICWCVSHFIKLDCTWNERIAMAVGSQWWET